MNRLLLVLITVLQLSAVACTRPQRAQTRAQPRPLEKQQREYQTPTRYELRDRGYDPKTGKMLTYDHRPRVELLDARAGKYAFKWVGYDGKDKTIIFQRADAIDVLVRASVSQTPEGKYLYTYRVENLPSSGTNLSHFIVQNFAPDTRPVAVNGRATNNQDLRLLDAFREAPPDGAARNLDELHIGQMSSLIEQFRDGYWIHVALLPEAKEQITPGHALEVKMLSAAPPGLVGCRAVGGELTLAGVGEDIPKALEDLLPGYEEFPRGSTIGPADNLTALAPPERARYVRDALPQLLKLGWMTEDARGWYEQHLLTASTAELAAHARADADAGSITGEVLSLIEMIKR